MARTKLEGWAANIIEEQLEQIDERINELNAKLEVYDRVKLERDKLLSARRALMGVGSRTTANAGTRVTQDEVAKAFNGSTGLTVQELASKVGTNDAVIRGHLSRGNNQRFLKRGDRWYLRNPEGGINTVDDLMELDSLGDE